MLVIEYMTVKVITLDESTSILEAADLMKKNRVRRFPVMRDEKLVGIVTDRDLRSAAPSQVITLDEQERQLLPELHKLLVNTKIRDIMTQEVITVDPEDTVVKAARLMLKHRISGIPVVVGPVLLGIITEGDLFKVLVDFSGAKVGKTTFAFQLEDRAGFVKQIAEHAPPGVIDRPSDSPGGLSHPETAPEKGLNNSAVAIKMKRRDLFIGLTFASE